MSPRTGNCANSGGSAARIGLLPLLLLGVASASFGQTEKPGPCGPATYAVWKKHRALLADAVPGDNYFLPHPYPSTEAELVADFEYRLQRQWSFHSVESMPPGESEVLKAIEKGDVTYRVARVKSNTPGACHPSYDLTFYWVLRIVQRSTGNEFARWALHPSGMLAHGMTPSKDTPADWWDRSMPDLGEVRRLAASDFGVETGSAEYVTAEGYPELPCGHATAPCVRLVSGDRFYFYSRLGGATEADRRLGVLYEVGPHSRRLPRAEVQGPEGIRALKATISHDSEAVVTIDHATLAVARKIQPREPDPS